MSLFRRYSRRQQRKYAYRACAALWSVHTAIRCAALPHALRIASVPHAAPPRLALTRYVLAGLDIWSSCARGGDWSGHRRRHERVDRRGPSREHALTHKALQSTAIPDPALTMHPCDCSNACTLRHIPPVALLGSGTQHPTRLTDAVHRSSSTRLRSDGCSAGEPAETTPSTTVRGAAAAGASPHCAGVATWMLCAVACCVCAW